MESTTVVNKLSEFKSTKNVSSILCLINESTTPAEVNYFLRLGTSYKHASNKTRKMWKKAADKKFDSFSKK